jgi:RHS repeat-associated protein
MPVWSVTEPEANLWLEDQPLLYRPSLGPEVRVLLRYKDQSGKRDDFRRVDTNVFSVGARWSFSLRAYVQTANITNSGACLFTGDGRAIQYTLGDTNIEYGTRSTLVWSTNQYILSQPDGSKEYYAVGTEGTDMREDTTVYRYFLGRRVDPQGNELTFNYTTNGTVKLTSLVDANNRTTQIDYTTNAAFAALVSRVTDPDANFVEFKYSATGCLTNIIDPAGLDSRMDYDDAQNLLRLKTPYGQTSFDFPFDTNQPALRAVKVTEPTGGVHLFLAAQQVPSDLVPETDTPPPTEAVGYTNTFNNGNLNQWNSFCWGPRQYGLLSATAKALADTNSASFATNLTATDYARGRMRHWLTRNGSFGTTLALERDPSSDGITEGRKTWYDHEGKTGSNNEGEGTMRLPLCVAVTVPGNTNESMFTWTPRNALGRPTQEIATWTDANGTWSTRTNGFGYSADNLDLLAVTNAFGKQVSLNLYNTAHLVATNWNVLNEITSYAYNAKGQLTNVSRPSGLQSAYLYFTSGTYAGWLDKTIDYEVVSGTNFSYYRTNAYAYSSGRLYTSTDARGLVVTNYWDGLGRLTGQSDAGGAVTNLFTVTTNTYANSSGGTNLLDLTASQDRNGSWTYYFYDGLRLLTGMTDANTNSTWYSYCDCGALESVTTPMTNVTSYSYDDAGRLLATAYPSGLQVTNLYDTANRLVGVRDSLGALTNTYNNQSLLTTVSNLLGRLSSASYDLGDRVTSRTDANAVTTSFGYDDLGRLTTRLVSGTATETNTYSARGLVAYVNPLGITNAYDYDALGRKVAETNGNLEVTQFSFSAASDLLTLVDGRGKQTSWGYDQFGQVTNKVDHNDIAILRYQYDAGGRLTNRWSKGKANTAYAYDPVGNLTQVTYDANTNSLATNVVTYAYDKDNRLTTMVDSAGTTAYGYANGLLASENGPWANDTVSYAFNNGQRESLTLLQPNASSWIESYGYDAGRRLTSVTSPAGTFGYTYAGPGSLVTNLVLPGSWATGNQFDSVGRLTGTYLRNGSGSVANEHLYTYNTASHRTRQTRLAGDYVDYTYDAAGQLKTALGKESGGATNRLAEQLGYVYDAGGNLQYRTNNALVQSFSVDNVNQLTTIARTGTLTVAGGTSATATNVTVKDNANSAVAATLYADKTFARTNVMLVDGSNTFTAVATDGYGRGDTNTVTVTLPASVTYTYDDNGNLTSDGQQSFEYDGENQLVAVQVTASWRSEFRYDGKLRRRVRVEKVWQNNQWVTASETRYVYDGMLVVQERDANNLPAVSYTRGRDLSGTRAGAGGIGGLLARTDNRLLIAGDPAAHACYHADGNGNITALANGTQGVVARYLYDPYGNLLAKAGSLADANLYRFSSKEVHASSALYYYGYRFYVPSLQRWVNRDPILERGGVNLYAFAARAPTFRLDAQGLTIEFHPEAANPTFVERWRECICRLAQTPTGADILRLAADPEITIIINFYRGFPRRGPSGGRYPTPRASGREGEVSVDQFEDDGIGPQSYLKTHYPDELPPERDPNSCAVVLAHELGHALGHEDEGEGGDNVSTNENPVRRELGMPERSTYHHLPVDLLPVLVRGPRSPFGQ